MDADLRARVLALLERIEWQGGDRDGEACCPGWPVENYGCIHTPMGHIGCSREP